MVLVAEKILMSLKMIKPTEAGSGVGGDRLILRCQGDNSGTNIPCTVAKLERIWS